MNKHIELVKKWLEDPDSVTQEELDDNVTEIDLEPTSTSIACASAAAASGLHLNAAYWVMRYGEIEEPPEHEMTCEALKTQVGGNHYKAQGLQPFEITYANFGYKGIRAAVYTKVNKYLTRDKGEHVENIQKAIHCLQIQLDYATEEDK